MLSRVHLPIYRLSLSGTYIVPMYLQFGSKRIPTKYLHRPWLQRAWTGVDKNILKLLFFLLGCRGWCWTEFTSLVLSWLPPRDSCLLKINEILDFLAKYTPVDTPQNLQLTEDSSIRIPCILGSHIVHSKGQLS